MSQEPFFGNWMVAIAEAAEVAGASDLDTASALQLRKAWDLVASAAHVSVEALAERIADEAEMEIADFARADRHAAKVVPPELAWQRRIVPVGVTDRDVVVATSDPMSRDARRDVALVTGREVRLVVATPEAIETALMDAYGDSPTGGPAVSPDDQVKPGGPHILVVDDEAGARALFRSVLEGAGFRVSVAKDGPQAMVMLDGEHDFDLVTLDYWMQKMNGLRVLQHIRSASSTPGLPVIMVTGAGDRQIAMSLFEAGADDFINKPIDAPLFLLRIQAVMRRRITV